MRQVILTWTDPSAPSPSAVAWAEREARLHGLPLRVVQGAPPDPGGAKMIVCGVPRAARAAGAETGHRLPGAFRRADRPLVLVPDGTAPPPPSGRVLLGTDARHPADDVTGFAFDSARRRDALLHVVHTWSLPSRAAEWPFGVPERERAAREDHEVQLLADVLRPWRERYPHVPVYEDVVLLTPARALTHHARSASLVVVGTDPGTGWGELVRTLLRETTCPVALVPTRTAP
ncbi:nucleotide-binding universal stress UspA family protein [Streptomyces sp. 3330]|uniref:universal stress protein n=1 Tax=Streptomyces sp. 3330 TaxID=2817755 RepID=UPI00285EBBE8|nr:universal stress protein [Streptomyces sp. 3330]MDR6975924.1 nucleotide-binding universal stress UspA family protein [Streptomyces sp. 3330]